MKKKVFEVIIIMVIMVFSVSGCKNNIGNEMSEVVDNTQVGNETESDKVEVETGEHTHSYTSEVTKDATCSETGTITYTCKCGDAYKEDIAALGHQYGEYIYNNDATTSSEGTKTATCSICGNKDTVIASGTIMHQHSYEETISKTATCEKDGVKTFTCQCGDSYTEEIVATGHQYGEYVYNKDATFDKDGTQTAVCSVCGDVNTTIKSGTKLERVLEYNNDKMQSYKENAITIQPIHVSYLENGKVYVKCYVINALPYAVTNVDCTMKIISNTEQKIIVNAFINDINTGDGKDLASNTYYVCSFTINTDAVENYGADLSEIAWQIGAEYEVLNKKTNQMTTAMNNEVEAFKYTNAMDQNLSTIRIPVGGKGAISTAWQNYTLYSQNTDIASIDGKTITGVSKGTTYVIIKQGSIMQVYKIIVE